MIWWKINTTFQSNNNTENKFKRCITFQCCFFTRRCKPAPRSRSWDQHWPRKHFSHTQPSVKRSIQCIQYIYSERHKPNKMLIIRIGAYHHRWRDDRQPFTLHTNMDYVNSFLWATGCRDICDWQFSVVRDGLCCRAWHKQTVRGPIRVSVDSWLVLVTLC